ncbi:hypothetical protein AB0K48_33830 [Nonomuraea sp. NPDC055795]
MSTIAYDAESGRYLGLRWALLRGYRVPAAVGQTAMNHPTSL